MLDYMMWPWSERSKLPSALHDKKFQFPTDKFPKLVKYPQLIMQNNLCFWGLRLHLCLLLTSVVSC